MSELILQVDILEDGQVVDSHELSDKKIKVGKLASSQLHLDDPKVSRIHAVLERQGDGTYQAIDLGSASGTYINGTKITKGVVRNGDELRFGETTVRVTIVDLVARRQAQQEAAAAQAVTEVPEGHIELEDGTVVEPFTMEGYYDDAGNYIPGYYDHDGLYHYGYGYYDDEGAWQVAHGFYDPEGEWVPTPPPEGERPSDTELYTAQFFSDDSGGVLEIAYLWSDAVLDVQTFKKPRSVFIGGDETNDYVLEDQRLTHPKFPLVVFEEHQGYRVVFTGQMQGTIQREGEQYSLDEAIEQGLARPSSAVQGGFELAMTRGTSVRLDFGRNTFLLHFTSMPAMVAGASIGLEGAPFFYQSVSLALHVAFMLLVFMLPDGYGGLELSGLDLDDRFAEMDLDPEDEEEEEDELDAFEDDSDPEDAQEAEAPPEDREVTEEDIEIEGADDMDEDELQDARDQFIAQEAGALAALGDPQSAIGPDMNTNLVGLDTDVAGDGTFGFGAEGPGRIGAGDGEGLGHAGVGGGTGPGGGGTGGTPSGSLDHETLNPTVVPQEPVTEGALDREIIQRVVRQNRRDIQNCYEAELNRDPTLQGRITMQWVISPSGDVVSASVQESTMNNSAVEQCMAQRIQRWSFPAPDGGGIVRVNYPFNFST